MPDLNPDPLPQPEAPRAPFVGVIRRAGAFLFDCVLLFLIGSVLERVARPALLQLNPALPWLSFGLICLYFFIGHGPLTGGRTLGKVVLHLATVDAAGKPLSHRAALRRAWFQACGFVPVIGFNAEYTALLLPSAARYDFSLMLAIIMLVSLTWLAALLVGVGVHPWKRGWHDLWAGSFVTLSPTPETFFSTLAEPPDPLTQARLDKHRLITLVFWLLATIALLLYPLRMVTRPEIGTMRREQAEIDRTIDLRPFVVTKFGYPGFIAEGERLAYAAGLRARQQRTVDEARRRGQETTTATVATTATLLASLSETFDALGARALLPHGSCHPALLSEPRFRAEAEELRRLIWSNFQNFKPPANEPVGKALFFRLDLYEPFQLLLNINNERRAVITGPADPAAGPLRFETQAPRTELLTHATDESTTATTP